MEDTKKIELENLIEKQKEAKDEFKIIQKYVKQELKLVKDRIKELESILNQYHKLESNIECILDETKLIEEGIIDVKDNYEFHVKDEKNVFEDLYLVKGWYLIKITGIGHVRDISIEMDKKRGKRWRKYKNITEGKGEILIEVEYAGEYFLSVDARGEYNIEIIKR